MNRNFFLGSHQRKMPGLLQLKTIGWNIEPEYPDVKAVRPSIDFHFVLDGKGFAVIDGKEYVLMPDTVAVFFPDRKIHHWSKEGMKLFWIDFDKSYTDIFKRILDNNPHVWKVNGNHRIMRLLIELQDYTAMSGEPGFADRIDRMAERFILECVMASEKPFFRGKSDPLAGQIIQYMSTNFRKDINLKKLPKKFGISRTAFFQKWKNSMAVSPLQYLIQLRIEEACRLLTDTDMKIYEIAANLNFRDPLYFSRQFRKVKSISASEYRDKYRSLK